MGPIVCGDQSMLASSKNALRLVTWWHGDKNLGGELEGQPPPPHFMWVQFCILTDTNLALPHYLKYVTTGQL